MSSDKTTLTSILHLGSLLHKQNPGSRLSFQSSRTRLTPKNSPAWSYPTLESSSGKFTCFLMILRFLHAPITLIVISYSRMKYFIFSRTKRSTCIIQILLSCVPFSFVLSWTADSLIWKEKKYQKPYFLRLFLNRECTWLTIALSDRFSAYWQFTKIKISVKGRFSRRKWSSWSNKTQAGTCSSFWCSTWPKTWHFQTNT